MRRFRFSLQRLLRLRTQGERLARRELAAAVSEVTRIRDRLEVLSGSLRACRTEIAAGTSTAALAEALEGGLSSGIARLQRDLAEAERQVELRRAAYRHRQRDAAALRRLRDRRHTAWRFEAERESQAEMDEMARVRYESRRREGAQR